MKGNIMDKKILLSGAAALLLAGSMFATSASASALTVSHSGEASLSAVFSNACSTNQANLDDGGADANEADGVSTDVETCGSGNSDDMPVWETKSKLEWSASGTLANGLGISIAGGAGAEEPGDAITLSGAFGSLTWEDGGDTAVKMALPNSLGDLDVTATGFGGHAVSTPGSAGYNINWQAPSVGGMDIYVTYTPSSNNAATNTDAYLDTIAVGAKMTAGDITIGAGWESATYNTNVANANANACAGAADLDVASSGDEGQLAHANNMLEGDICEDVTLMGIGASMNVSDLALNAGYTKLDSDGGDRTTYNIGLGTTVGDYSVALDYVNTKLDYLYGTADASSVETILGVGVSTDIGDGVNFGVNFNNQSINVLDTGAHTNYRAEAKLTVTY
jgi:hypothetical protein